MLHIQVCSALVSQIRVVVSKDKNRKVKLLECRGRRSDCRVWGVLVSKGPEFKMCLVFEAGSSA